MHETRILVGAAVSLAAVVATAAACATSSVGPSSGSGSRTSTPSGRSSSSSPSASTSSSAAGTSLTVTATIQRKQGQVLAFVPLTVGSVRTMFVLDSGASTTVLDAAIARKAGLHSSTVPGRTKTLGCSRTPKVTEVTTWSLGGKALAPSKLVTQDLGFGSARIDGLPIGGLLGADAQASTKAVTIDYATGKVTFGASAPSGGRSVALKVLTQGTEVVAVAPVTIGGTPVSMVVDTGASRTTLAARTVARARLAKDGPAGSVNAAGCPAKVQPVTLTGARIGGVAVPSGVIDSTSGGTPTVASAVGLFGSDLLSTYTTVTIDYADKKLILG